MRILSIILVMGLVLMGFIPQNVVISTARGASSGSSSSNFNGSQYLQGVATRIQIALGVVAGTIIMVLWFWKVVIPMASHDSQRKTEAKENIKDMAVVTLIAVMAVGGVIWLLGKWIAGV